MTEEEAKTKWCPFVQVSLGGKESRLANNRGQILKNKDRTNLKCIGSECMAWRATDNEFIPMEHRTLADPFSSKPAGYCGLAGKP
ncbi:MAG: hypothetical protein ACR2PS_05645 [Pseudomonadales bacterium]